MLRDDEFYRVTGMVPPPPKAPPLKRRLRLDATHVPIAPFETPAPTTSAGERIRALFESLVEDVPAMDCFSDLEGADLFEALCLALRGVVSAAKDDAMTRTLPPITERHFNLEKVEKHDLVVVKSVHLGRQQLRVLRRQVERANPKWCGALVHLHPTESLDKLSGPVAFNLCKALMREFFPEMHAMVVFAEQEHRKDLEKSQKEAAVAPPQEAPQ